jgi:monoamine oxidase
VLKQFQQMMDDDRALSPTAVYEKDWPADVWMRGCPVGVMAPGTLIDYGETLRQPLGRVHWAGTETSNYWCGYMDGAVRSGERASAEVLAEV